MSPHQHAYMANRGVHTALYAIINKLKKSKGEKRVIFEYDLTSFFNLVNLSSIYELLKEKDEFLANFIMKIIFDIRYSFEEIEEENELKKIGEKR